MLAPYPGRHRKRLRIALTIFPFAAFAFWLVTAPGSMAIQRIAAGTGRGPIAIFIINAADWYDAPMALLVKSTRIKRINDSLADTWCEILGAPETTP